VSAPRTGPNHVSQSDVGEERHPYEKPVPLFLDLLETGTPNGQIFDGFAGSGAAGVAAVRLGYPYIGAEKQPWYVAMANRRIATALAERDGSPEPA